jgi:flagellar hook-associated protein 2
MRRVSTSSTPAINLNIPTFTGLSQFASTYQQILNTSLQTAEIPVTQLQTQDSAVLAKETALGTINSAVAALSTSLTSLATVASNGGLGATSSDPSSVSVAVTGATAPATYTINSITSAAAAASETSLNPVADSNSTPVSSTGYMELDVGSQKYDFTLTTNSLTGLENQINSLNAGVTASILTTAGANYLSVQANATGATTLKLIDNPITATNPGGTNTNMLTDTTAGQGTDAVFQLNGINIDQPGNTVNSVIPGMTFTILNSTSSPVTLSLASDPTQLSSALQNLVTNYNALQTQLVAQTGTAGGALVGDTIVNQLQQTMRDLTGTYVLNGTVHSLADLGVSLSNTGQMSFNQSTFDALSSTQITDGFAFVSSTSAGIGGYGATFDQFSDPITGLIQAEQSGLSTADLSLQGQISTLETHISQSQTNLTAQMEAADALQYNLQSQQQTLTGSLEGLSLVLYGKSATEA